MAAAAARKLQKEIDTTLKKVEEQRQEFSEVWEEAMNANAAHREKLGEELKRCINKLQRSRVQIREWIAAEKTEQKTMDRLEESRRRIEKDMQRFKEFERELKTKAYSTQALLKEEDMDVLCVEKKQNIEWLILQLHNLHDLQDEVEADLESLTKKEESRRLELTAHDERHRWHLEKLERLLRSLQNDEVDMTELAVLKEIVEDYMERHKEAEYYHDDNMYDVFFTDEPCANSKDDDAGTPNAAASQKSTDFTDIPGACKTSVSSVTPSASAKKPKERKKKDKGAKVPPRAEPIKSEKKCTRTTENSLDKDSEKKPPQEVKIQEDQLVGEAEEFICKICYVHVVGNGPFLTNCSHLFCGDCLQEWFQTHPECQSWAQRAKATGPQRIVPCPVCKQNLNEKTDLYPVCSTSMRSENLLLWRMLSSLKVMCKNHPNVSPVGNCGWIGEYGTYQAHIQVCENMAVMNHSVKDGKSSVSSFQTASISSVPLFKPDSPPVRASSSSALSTDIKPAIKTSVKSVSQAGCEAKSSSAAPKAKAQTASPNHANNVDGVDADSGHNAMHTNAAIDRSSSSAHAMEMSKDELYHSAASFQPNGHSGKGQIAVAELDTIEVFQRHDSGWSYGKVYTPEGAYAEGWFPSWVVGPKIQLQKQISSQSLPEAPVAEVPTEAKAVSIQRFPVQNAFSSTDSSQLSLAVGDMVEVIERHATGWTFGRLLSSDKEGWFPDWVGSASVC